MVVMCLYLNGFLQDENTHVTTTQIKLWNINNTQASSQSLTPPSFPKESAILASNTIDSFLYVPHANEIILVCSFVFDFLLTDVSLQFIHVDACGKISSYEQTIISLFV